MNATNPRILARYVARLLALLIAANLALLVKDPRFASLISQAALIADTILIGGWVVIILGGFANTGDIAPTPPAALIKRMEQLESVQAEHETQLGGLEGAVSGIAARLPEPPPVPPRA
jgi:hypothetical protein